MHQNLVGSQQQQLAGTMQSNASKHTQQSGYSHVGNKVNSQTAGGHQKRPMTQVHRIGRTHGQSDATISDNAKGPQRKKEHKTQSQEAHGGQIFGTPLEEMQQHPVGRKKGGHRGSMDREISGHSGHGKNASKNFTSTGESHQLLQNQAKNERRSGGSRDKAQRHQNSQQQHHGVANQNLPKIAQHERENSARLIHSAHQHATHGGGLQVNQSMNGMNQGAANQQDFSLKQFQNAHQASQSTRTGTAAGQMPY